MDNSNYDNLIKIGGCFSDELIARVQDYFLQRCKQSLSREEAITYLHSLADLYLAYRGLNEARLSVGGRREPPP